QDAEAECLELRALLSVALDIPPKLRPPVGRVPFWLPGQPTTLVQVPEASVHEDRDTAALDRDVRLARQALEAVALDSDLVRERLESAEFTRAEVPIPPVKRASCRTRLRLQGPRR